MTSLIEQACACLAQSGVVAIPTESVYGLAGDATDDKAIATIYAIKNRPAFNPLIVHTADLSQALEYGVFVSDALKLAHVFWAPGQIGHRPLTLVVPIRTNSVKPLSRLATNNLPTVGIRVPNHSLTQELLRAYSHPLAAPSANLSTQVSATTAAIVRATLGDRVPVILDGGPCLVGLESTIIDTSVTPFTVLRYGGTTIEEIANVLGYTPLSASLNEAIKAPGMLKKHYAPSIKVRTNQKSPHEGAAYLGFGSQAFGSFNLSPRGDLQEAAANLFRFLFELDDPAQFEAIDVAPIPNEGLGRAINDRLKRASV